MYSGFFLISAIIYAFFDQTSIRFPLVYFLIAVGILGLVFAKRLSGGISLRMPKEVAIFWFLLITQAVLSLITSSSTSLSKIGLALTLSALMFFCAGGAIKEVNRKRISLILMISSIVFSLVSLEMLLKIIPPLSIQSSLFSWTFGHNRIAGLLILLLPPAMIYAFSLTSQLRILIILSLIFPFLTLIFSAGRAAILGFLLGLVYLSRFGPPDIKRWLKLIAIAGLLPILALMIFPVVARIWPDSGLMKLINSDQATFSILVKPLAGDARFDYWSQAARAIVVRPFGWGMEATNLVLPRFRLEGEQISAYVHNQYLQAGVETGIVGALIYILLIVSVLRQAHRTVKADVSGWSSGIFAGILASAVAAFFDYDWQYPSIYLLWWFLAGTLMAGGQQVLEENSKSRWPKIVVVLSMIVLIYGSYSALTKLALNGAKNNWNSWGKSVFRVASPPSYALHPELGEQALAIALANLPVKQIPQYIKQNRVFFRFDNRMMEKVLRWQEAFGNKNDATATAMQMLENDPRNTYAKEMLDKYTPATH